VNKNVSLKSIAIRRQAIYCKAKSAIMALMITTQLENKNKIIIKII